MLLAKAYRPIRLWQWAGGIVSEPPGGEKLRADGKGWIPPGTIDNYWHFRLQGCGGSLDYYSSVRSYSFEIGPVGCER